MTFIETLKRQLKENKGKIKVKAPLSSIPESNWGDLSITSLNQSSVMLSSPIENLKIRFQPLLSGSRCVACPYRLDSHSNKPLHTHFYKFESFLNIPKLSEVLIMVLGSDYKLLEDENLIG